jgi:hypothetical protein
MSFTKTYVLELFLLLRLGAKKGANKRGANNNGAKESRIGDSEGHDSMHKSRKLKSKNLWYQPNPIDGYL